MLLITVENHPLQPAGVTTTYGQAVCSSATIDAATWAHETQHYKQWQTAQLGAALSPVLDFYLLSHVAAQTQSYVRKGDYASGNPLETGLYSSPPRAWP
jgi:hypothetical protein